MSAAPVTSASASVDRPETARRSSGRRPRPRGPHRSRRSTIGLGLVVLACSLVFVVPLYWLITSALKPNEQIYTWPLTWIPRSIDLGNVVEAWNAAPFDRFFVNSAITTGVGTLLEMGLAIMSAYAFAFIPFRYKKVLFVLVIGSLMLPGHVTLIVNYITVANLGWLNTYQGLILPGIGSAFAMFLLYQHMRTLDPEILQAAEIDGAGHVRRMLTIVVPLTSPMILTATLIVLIGKWNEYVWPLIVTSTADMRTLPIGLLFLRSQEGYSDWGALLAGTVMASAPMLLLFFLAQKRIIGGLAAGALK